MKARRVSTIKPKTNDYRPEIDGLRAFAVLSVVWYHAFPETLTGGFVGVDVFFVISGYLITSHVFVSLDNGSFSLSDFFQRRIRRIFPALIVVMSASLIVGWIALLGDELNQLAKHMFGGATFIINFILVNESGYFDTASDQKPMLHLWSLAVEEQFYIFWPLALWMAWKRHVSFLWITLFVVGASFLFNLSFVLSKPTAIFFWPFGRFWELLSGSLLAWFIIYKGNSTCRFKAQVDSATINRLEQAKCAGKTDLINNLMALGGLALLLYGVLTINSSLPFPSTWALFPVCGAVLVIAAGSDAWANRIIMMNPVAVWFGLISYPLYLWHWPILSFLRILESGEVPHRDARIAAVVLATILAWLTTKLIERPLRFGRRNVRAKVGGLGSGLIANR